MSRTRSRRTASAGMNGSRRGLSAGVDWRRSRCWPDLDLTQASRLGRRRGPSLRKMDSLAGWSQWRLQVTFCFHRLRSDALRALTVRSNTAGYRSDGGAEIMTTSAQEFEAPKGGYKEVRLLCRETRRFREWLMLNVILAEAIRTEEISCKGKSGLSGNLPQWRLTHHPVAQFIDWYVPFMVAGWEGLRHEMSQSRNEAGSGGMWTKDEDTSRVNMCMQIPGKRSARGETAEAHWMHHVATPLSLSTVVRRINDHLALRVGGRAQATVKDNEGRWCLSAKESMKKVLALLAVIGVVVVQ